MNQNTQAPIPNEHKIKTTEFHAMQENASVESQNNQQQLFQSISKDDKCDKNQFTQLMEQHFGIIVRDQLGNAIFQLLKIDQDISFKQFTHLLYTYTKFAGNEKLALFYAVDSDRNDIINQTQFQSIMTVMNINISTQALKQLTIQFSRNSSLTKKQYLDAFDYVIGLAQQAQ